MPYNQGLENTRYLIYTEPCLDILDLSQIAIALYLITY
jgi:hypothetical protein